MTNQVMKESSIWFTTITVVSIKNIMFLKKKKMLSTNPKINRIELAKDRI